MHGVAPHQWRTNAALSLQPRAQIWIVLQFDVSLPTSEHHRKLVTDNMDFFCRALAFEFVLFIFMFFPVAPNPDIPNFNWTLLVFGVVVIWAITYYHLWGKKKYAGPVAYVKRQDM